MGRKANSNSHFRAGSAVYNCRECGKATRETGASESQVELCLDCYDYAGWENSHSDDMHDENPEPACPVCQDLGLVPGPSSQGEEAAQVLEPVAKGDSPSAGAAAGRELLAKFNGDVARAVTRAERRARTRKTAKARATYEDAAAWLKRLDGWLGAEPVAEEAPAASLVLAYVGGGDRQHVAEGTTTLCGQEARVAGGRAYKRAGLRDGTVSCKRCRNVLQSGSASVQR